MGDPKGPKGTDQKKVVGAKITQPDHAYPDFLKVGSGVRKEKQGRRLGKKGTPKRGNCRTLASETSVWLPGLPVLLLQAIKLGVKYQKERSTAN